MPDMVSAEQLAEMRASVLADGELDPAPADQLVALAVRRWASFDRRHSKVKHPSAELRARDIERGLEQNYPGEILYVPPGNLKRLAQRFVAILGQGPGDDLADQG